MEEYLPLIIQLVSGAVGGNLAGKLMKNFSLGTLWNSIVGILGGGLGGQVLGMIGISDGGGEMDLSGILGSVAGGGVGGGILMAIIGAVKNAQLNTANKFPMSRPTTKSNAVTPCATKRGPITNSVPAVCSPAYIPIKLLSPLSFDFGIGSRSNSFTESSWATMPFFFIIDC